MGMGSHLTLLHANSVPQFIAPYQPQFNSFVYCFVLDHTQHMKRFCLLMTVLRNTAGVENSMKDRLLALTEADLGSIPSIPMMSRGFLE